ncbi:MAG: hypothetical protein LUD16_07230 [Lachnospiraceae bacterium]|nr:hypothetical protein [Lachnospiraceae bacterium]
MGAQNADEKKTDAFSRRLVYMFSEISPSFLEDEIPERDLERVLADSAEMKSQPEPEPRMRTNWRIVVAISGFAAACSAAVAGIAVFMCMRHFTALGGARRV